LITQNCVHTYSIALSQDPK